MVKDITERKREQEELRSYRDHLEDEVRRRTAELHLANEKLREEVAQRRRMEKALRRSEREVLEASRREQQRIGADIHDSLGQMLTGMSFLARALEERIAGAAPEAGAKAGELTRLAEQATTYARRLAHGLNPVEMCEEGLANELLQLATKTQELYGISCICTVEGNGHIHCHSTALHLFQIAREAVTNAVRHAKPNTITLRLATEEQGHLIVTDDGSWTYSDSEQSQGSGLGLRLMKNRAEIIGGTLEISTDAGRGTRVSCAFPNLP